MNALGEFLRAWRELVSPKDVGIEAGRFRRMPGLRREEVVELIDSWPTTAAYVQNQFTDVLAVNTLCAALSPNYRVGVNLLRAVFLDPAERTLRRDWETLAEEGVAVLRAQPKFGRTSHLRHPQVGDLQLRSNKLVISGTDGLMLVTFHAPPGTPDAERLAMLTLEPQPT